MLFLIHLGAPSKNKNGIFSEIEQKGGRGSSHFFECLRKNEKLQGMGGALGSCHYLISKKKVHSQKFFIDKNEQNLRKKSPTATS